MCLPLSTYQVLRKSVIAFSLEKRRLTFDVDEKPTSVQTVWQLKPKWSFQHSWRPTIIINKKDVQLHRPQHTCCGLCNCTSFVYIFLFLIYLVVDFILFHLLVFMYIYLCLFCSSYTWWKQFCRKLVEIEPFHWNFAMSV